MTTEIKKKYVDFITNLIDHLPAGIPIFTTEIIDQVIKEFDIERTQARGIVNTNLNRMSGTVIESFKKGIYYKPKSTAFGKSHLNPDHVVKKLYINPSLNDVVGYETGASFMHKLGLTTHMPKYQFIATNVATPARNRVINDLKVILRKPHLPITGDNFLYLQVLDILENKDRIVFDVQRPEHVISHFIEDHKLDFGKLLGVAMHYNKEVVFRLGKIAESTYL